MYNTTHIIWVFISVTLAQQPQILNPEMTSSGVADVRQRTLANFERIQNWRASWALVIENYYYRPESDTILNNYQLPETIKEVVEVKTLTVDFAFDRASGRCVARSHRQKVQRLDVQTGEELRTPFESWVADHSLLWTAERFVRAIEVGIDGHGQAIHEGSIHERPLPDDEDLLSFTDPRRIFGFDRRRPTWEGLLAITQWAGNRTGEEMRAAATTQPDQQVSCFNRNWRMGPSELHLYGRIRRRIFQCRESDGVTVGLRRWPFCGST